VNTCEFGHAHTAVELGALALDAAAAAAAAVLGGGEAIHAPAPVVEDTGLARRGGRVQGKHLDVGANVGVPALREGAVEEVQREKFFLDAGGGADFLYLGLYHLVGGLVPEESGLILLGAAAIGGGPAPGRGVTDEGDGIHSEPESGAILL